MSAAVDFDLAALIEPVARRLLGEPNRRLSSKTELRFGTRGSMAVDLAKGVWSDHELGQGGGVLDLIERETGKKGKDRFQWIVDEGLAVDEHKPNGRRRGNGHDRQEAGLGRIVAAYQYVDEVGQLLFEVVRFEPKDFRQRKQDPLARDGWTWKTKGVRQVPYRLPELIEAIALGKTVFVVEGERDADRLMALDVPATTNAMGAGCWKPELNQFFAGAAVVVIPDRDPQSTHKKTGAPMFHDDGRPVLPGQDHAEAVARHLCGVAARVQVLDLAEAWPAIPPHGDVSDWLDQGGGSREALYTLAENASVRLPDATKPRVDDSGTGPREDAPPVGSAIETDKPNFRTLAEFLREFRPISYAVAGLMREGSLYTLTGRTGEGKTAFLVILALAVAIGRGELIGRDVKKGRVAFCTAENPDDLRMRLMIACFVLNIDVDVVDRDIMISDNRVTPEAIADWVRSSAIDFTLIIVDTWQAYFDGKDANNPTQAVEFTRRFRPLANLAGAPVVIIAAHPNKSAADDKLIPNGAGSTLNEVDGNFTMLRDETGLHRFHWLGKIRGLPFEPLHFKIDRLDSPDVVTIEGARVPMPFMSPIAEAEVDARKERRANRELRLLRMITAPLGGERAWALALKVSRRAVSTMLANLAKEKLVEVKARKWCLTKAGEALVAAGEGAAEGDEEGGGGDEPGNAGK